jgi:16S rRNA (uracil1498-N3)-methyltransferase
MALAGHRIILALTIMSLKRRLEVSGMTGRPGPRLFVAEEIGAGRAVGLAPGQAHYLKNVMRLGPGDAVVMFNGRDGEWSGRVVELGRGAGSVSAESLRRPQAAEPDIWLLFAPIKRAPGDFLIQKAVELGVSCLWPVLTRHTDVGRFNLERARSTAVEAAEQCERLTLPEIRAPARLEDVLADWRASRPLLVCAESGPQRPIVAVLEELKAGDAANGAGMALLVGPEGGFATSELDALGNLPFVRAVSLGPRVLRAETAALAALACWQSVLGDWHTSRVQPSKAT